MHSRTAANKKQQIQPRISAKKLEQRKEQKTARQKKEQLPHSLSRQPQTYCQKPKHIKPRTKDNAAEQGSQNHLRLRFNAAAHISQRGAAADSESVQRSLKEKYAHKLQALHR